MGEKASKQKSLIGSIGFIGWIGSKPLEERPYGREGRFD